MDLPPLGDVELPSHTVELRIWIGFSHINPMTMVRLLESEGNVRGDYIFRWTDNAADSVEGVCFTNSMASAPGSLGCETAPIEMPQWSSDNRAVACKQASKGQADWKLLWHRLDSLDVRSIRDPASLSIPDPVGDALYAVFVEILEGDRYRSYSYWQPGSQAWPEARKVSRMVDIIFGRQ